MAVAGVEKSAWYSWRKRGRAGEEPYAALEAEIGEAEAEQELCYVARIRKAGRADWKANAWLLERSKPGRWAAKREENPDDEYTVEFDDED